MISNKKVFITGGAGFIGSEFISRIINNNEVVVYDNFKRNALENKAYKTHKNLLVVRGDVLDFNHLKSAMHDANIIVHCAAIAGIDTVILKPTETMRINMIGTANVLEAALQLKKLDRVIDFSTSEVFGQSAFRAEENQCTQIGAVGEARWTYAVSKLAAEHLTKAYHQEFNMPTVTLRPFNIYGPGQVGEGAMKTFIIRSLQNKDIIIHGDGNQIRAWCYIDDFIDGLICAIENPNAIGESLNIGNNRAVLTIFGLAQTVVRVLESSSQIKYSHKNYADVELRVPSIVKAKELIQFHAKVDLEEGILATAEFYRSNHKFDDNLITIMK